MDLSCVFGALGNGRYRQNTPPYEFKVFQCGVQAKVPELAHTVQSERAAQKRWLQFADQISISGCVDRLGCFAMALDWLCFGIQTSISRILSICSLL